MAPRLQADLDRLQAALDKAETKADKDINFDDLYCGTIAGWSAALKLQKDNDSPIAMFLLQGKKTIVKLDMALLAEICDYKPTGAVAEKLMMLSARAL